MKCQKISSSRPQTTKPTPLHDTHSREGPARSALALVLDGCDGPLGPPVNLLGQLHVIIGLDEGSSSVLAVGLVAPSVVATEAVHG